MRRTGEEFGGRWHLFLRKAKCRPHISFLLPGAAPRPAAALGLETGQEHPSHPPPPPLQTHPRGDHGATSPESPSLVPICCLRSLAQALGVDSAPSLSGSSPHPWPHRASLTLVSLAQGPVHGGCP